MNSTNSVCKPPASDLTQGTNASKVVNTDLAADDGIRARPRIRRVWLGLEEESEAGDVAFLSDTDEDTDLEYDSEDEAGSEVESKEMPQLNSSTTRASDMIKSNGVILPSPQSRLSPLAPPFVPSARLPSANHSPGASNFSKKPEKQLFSASGTPNLSQTEATRVKSHLEIVLEGILTIELSPSQWESGKVCGLTKPQKVDLLDRLASLHGISPWSISKSDQEVFFKAAVDIANSRLEKARYATPRSQVSPYASSAIPIGPPTGKEPTHTPASAQSRSNLDTAHMASHSRSPAFVRVPAIQPLSAPLYPHFTLQPHLSPSFNGYPTNPGIVFGQHYYQTSGHTWIPTFATPYAEFSAAIPIHSPAGYNQPNSYTRPNAR